ncbi:ribonuclease 2-5A-domain-containing protein [Flammula alnicola]|nr:ribonuclease 2-5A-domain-containing protein [Flammula alnicola]
MAFLLLSILLFWSLALAAGQALVQRHPQPQFEQPPPDLSKDYDLLDIVLVASIDGKFHALNRTSGHTLWSMSSFATTTSVSAPSSLHLDDPDASDDPRPHETYIIEPQSGDIYVLHSPSSPLQRFPFSMAELVDISPFTSVNKDDTKVFVGRKETSLIKATLNAECPFIPDEYEDASVDLDELEGSKPPISAPTEVYIGRTGALLCHKPQAGKPTPPVQELSFSTYGPNNKDNHLQSIYRRTNDDTYIQSLPNGEIIAFRTKSNGSGASGSSTGKSKPQSTGAFWGRPFPAPIVAIFDVLQPLPPSPHHHHPGPPFVLLQPRPRLQDLFPNLNPASSLTLPPHLGSAYVGVVEETGSLFVMSPERYPLVVFGGGGSEAWGRWRALDPPRAGSGSGAEMGGGGGGWGSPEEDGGSDAEREGEREGEREREIELDDCLLNPYAARCLVGVRPLEDGDGSEGRWRRLLDGPKTQTPATQQPMDDGSPKPSSNSSPSGSPNGNPNGQAQAQGPVVVGRPWDERDGDNTSGSSGNADGAARPVLGIEGRPPSAVPAPPAAHRSWTMLLGSIGGGSGADSGFDFGFGFGGAGGSGGSVLEALLVTLFFGVVAVWFVWGKVKGGWGWKSRGGGGLRDERKMSVLGVLPRRGEGGGERRGRYTNGYAPAVVERQEEVEVVVVRKVTLLLGPPPPTPATPGSTPGTPLDTPVPDTPTPNTAGVGDDADDSDAEGEGGASAAPGKRKSRRGKRGKKKKPGAIAASASGGDGVEKEKEDGEEPATAKDDEKRPSSLVLTTSSPKPPVVQQPSLIVSDTILGFGSHGTVGRAVAVKRLLQDFVTLAAREVSILQESDDHPTQIASGLRHLHALKLVHRDIKPQNILVSAAGAAGGGAGVMGGKGKDKLDVDQTSFLPTAHGAAAAGTVGWRAPEILRGEVKLDELSGGDESSMSSRGSVRRTPTRLTKSVDIFALGCLFYYTLTNGGHPYGDRFEREVNIMRDAKDLSGLDKFGEEGTEAMELIGAMLSPEAKMRPDTTTILLHPFFWDAGRRLNFLQDASDRFEIMCRDPKDAHLLALEKGAQGVVGNDWHARLDKIFIENLGKSVQDLMRALRNKKHHYQDLPENVKRHLGPMPEGFLGYFTRRYPRLFLHVHGVIRDTGLHSESMFRTYFELPDT